MPIDQIKTRLEEAQKKHYRDTEKLLVDELPEGALLEDCEWVPNGYIRGANTLCYKGKPIISLFPVEMKEKQSEEGIQMIIEQKYYKHPKAQKE